MGDMNDYKLICNNEKIVIPFIDYLFEQAIDSINSMTGSKCNVYQILKPIASFQTVLLLEEFSPFTNVFKHKYEV